MSARDLDVVVAGVLCLDIAPGFDWQRQYRLEEVFTPGRLVNVQNATLSTGGAVSNTGIALVKQGMKTAFMAKVGGDEFGRLTLERLAQWADVGGIKVSADERSSYTVVIAPPGVDRIFFHCPATNHTFSSMDIDESLGARARIFHLGYPPLMKMLYQKEGEQLLQIFKRMKALGTTTSLDMALPDPRSEAGQLDWRRIYQRVLPEVDLVHPSLEEGLFTAQPEKWKRLHEQAGDKDLIDISSGEDLSELSDLFLSWGAAVVTLKAGHRGIYLRTANEERLSRMGAAIPAKLSDWAERELWMPPYQIEKIASACGAGDASLAGFIAAFLRKESPVRCLKAANALGYQNLQALDAISGVGDWDATLNIMNDHSRKQLPFSPSAGWRFDANLGLAIGPNDKGQGYEK